MSNSTRSEKKGKLKVFLGMCPGVGKTYSMLQAAQQKQSEGLRVTVGIIETHGRAETEQLLNGLPLVPRCSITYRNSQFEELNLDGVIESQADLVLIDELAHSNVPGSRHPKRYQDILEVLHAGISVYTAVNIQHLESRADAVCQITGITIRETIPDSFLDQADEIELVDVTSQILGERLAEGKVYLGERADSAAANFFKKENITALREMALRYTAELVDRDLLLTMNAQKISGPWKASERLMVAVGPSPYSTSLVRYTRRAAAARRCSWVAVHVDTGLPLTPADSSRLTDNLNLARQLGAEMVLISGTSVPKTLIDIAKERNVTQIIVGKTETHFPASLFGRASLLEKLLRLSGDIDILAVRPAMDVRYQSRRFQLIKKNVTSKIEWIEALLLAGCLTILNLLMVNWVGYQSVALFFLAGVILSATRLSRGPVLTLALLSALIWDFLFIPPFFTFTIAHTQDQIMFGIFILTAFVLGQFTTELKRKELIERKREQETEALLELTNDIALAPNLYQGLSSALSLIDRIFNVRSTILLYDSESGKLSSHTEIATSFAPSEKDYSVANWAFEKQQKAGRFTDSLPDLPSFWIPLSFKKPSRGVVGIQPDASQELSYEELQLLSGFCIQLGQLVEKEQILKDLAQADLSSKADQFRKILLDSVSHEIKTPLASMQTAVEGLELSPDHHMQYCEELKASLTRLNRIVNNILDMTRLEAGALKPHKEWCDIEEIISDAQELVGKALLTHPINKEILPQLPIVKIDPALLEQSLFNILLNITQHTSPDTPVIISATVQSSALKISVTDQGGGLPYRDLEELFTPFSRGNRALAGGSGLGLAIARGFIRIQGGELTAERPEEGGSRFIITLPVEQLEQQ